jgi:hypothetical protein
MEYVKKNIHACVVFRFTWLLLLLYVYVCVFHLDVHLCSCPLLCVVVGVLDIHCRTIALLITNFKQVFESDEEEEEEEDGAAAVDHARSSSQAARARANTDEEEGKEELGRECQQELQEQTVVTSELSALVIDPGRRAKQLLHLVSEEQGHDSEVESAAESGPEPSLVSYEEKTRSGQVDLEEQDADDFWSGSFHAQV